MTENKQENKQKKDFKTWFKAQARETVETIVFVVVAVIIIRFFVGELRWIPSGSMRPTLIEKDRVFVERVSHWTRTPQRGDILVFYPPEEKLNKDFLSVFARLTGIFCKDIAFIKRVVGLPGDNFEIKQDSAGESFVYINGERLDEPYISSTFEWTDCNEGILCGPFVIPEGHYFMMGDNRGNSQDSRFWGFLPKNRIIGRSIFVFWPLNRLKLLKK